MGTLTEKGDGEMAMNLKLGSSGSEVTKLQTALKDAGYDPGGIDGKFGQNTRSALVLSLIHI